MELRSWMVAIMQGSIQHEVCQLDPSSARVTQNDSEVYIKTKTTLNLNCPKSCTKDFVQSLILRNDKCFIVTPRRLPI